MAGFQVITEDANCRYGETPGLRDGSGMIQVTAVAERPELR
jgi:hypothetical protein